MRSWAVPLDVARQAASRQLHSVAAGIEQFAIVLDLRERRRRCRKAPHRPWPSGMLCWRTRICHKPDQGLERPDRVGAQGRLVNFVDRLERIQELLDRLVAQRCAIR